MEEPTTKINGQLYAEEQADNIVEVKNLMKHFGSGNNVVQAVDDVSFNIKYGETLGLVGESGCGKSTLGRTMTRLYEATSGKVFFEGEDIHQMSRKQLKRVRRDLQMIFQDPYASLNPRMTVEDIVGESIDVHRLFQGKERKEHIVELLELVGLRPSHMNRYPHEFSGGQCQRIGIARALAVNPKMIVCDEPISALDVSVQAQVINLLESLQEDMGLTYLFIAHDLSMVKYISDRVAVMYLGKIVELANSEKLYEKPLHPYTQSLLTSIPIPDPKVGRERERIILKGDIPSPINPPSGCRFRTRCPVAMDICSQVEPTWEEIEPNHYVACHLY